MQILNAIREHYLMKREADHGSQLFWDRIFLTLGLQSFTPARLCCQAATGPGLTTNDQVVRHSGILGSVDYVGFEV